MVTDEQNVTQATKIGGIGIPKFASKTNSDVLLREKQLIIVVARACELSCIAGL